MQKLKANILVVDDDPTVLTTAKLFLKQKFEFVQTLESPDQLQSVLSDVSFDLVLLDMNYSPGENDGHEGLEWIEHIVKQFPSIEVLPITAYGEIDLAVEALKRGARDFVTKPWQNEKLFATISNLLKLRDNSEELKRLKEENQELSLLHEVDYQLVGSSKPFVKVLETIEKVAQTDANVLILGENGTGKEMVARALHHRSKRSDNRFVSVDLGSLVTGLFESELFGHVEGAFTDAKSDRTGKFSLANKGTLFLDEIGNINAQQQAVLLSALEQQKITPVGSNTAQSLDLRVISATNNNITDMVREGSFRQDLLYRINTIEIEIPSLRDRIDDIPELTKHFLSIYKKKYKKDRLRLLKETIKALQGYHWPGNIRELSHAIERAVIMTDEPTLTPNSFLLKAGTSPEAENLNLQEMEKSLILKSLEKNKGNITHAAKDLGIDRLALYRRLEKYGL